MLKIKERTKETIGYYWQASKKYKTTGLVMFFSLFFASILELCKPILYKHFFDQLTSSAPRAEVFSSLVSILIFIALIQLSVWFLRRVNNFVANYFESKVMADLSSLCFSVLHRQSFSFFNNNFIGAITKKAKWFVSAYEGITDRLIWNLTPLFVGIVFVLTVLARVNIWLGVGLFVWLLVFLSVNYIFVKFKLKHDLAKNELETQSTALLSDTVTNNANVKLFNGYQREVDNYAEMNNKLHLARRFAWDMSAVFDGIQTFLMISLELGIMFYALVLWQKGSFSLGTFVMIQSYLGTIMNHIWSFGNVIRATYQNLADAEEMTEILSKPLEIIDAPGAQELRVKSGLIEFSNVDFSYLDGQFILKNFNLKIKTKERLAIIGPSGAGKTTVVKTLFRMHDIKSGKITIDSQDISRVTQESLWQNVSLVPQDPILFHRTLKENIAYGRPGATDKQIIMAAKAANCHDFIIKQEKGYDTYVGERGVKLSGGERQRIAIARAILRNAPILVLDEATSSLDSESESLIQGALDNLMKNKTVIVIAHRLSTIKRMDRIVVVDNGQVVEEGTHQDLALKDGSIYGKLWQLQAGGFVA